MPYVDIFEKKKGLIAKVGTDKAHLAWAMALYLEDADVDGLAAVALTDGPDDKKIDFIYIDRDAKRIVFAQGFYATKQRDTAPSNKAADLNTAIAWLLSGDITIVPETIRLIISDCREAIEKEEIDSIELLYVHNLPESVNVSRELQTAEEHLKKIVQAKPISVRAIELGATRIQHLYDSQDSHIDVKDEVEFPSEIAFEEAGPKWKAYVSSVPGTWLHTAYTRYSDDLFSANYRGFLGSNRRRRVNAGIRESAETRPSDFWAFNNGITILTMAMKKNKAGRPTLSGMSIINGA